MQRGRIGRKPRRKQWRRGRAGHGLALSVLLGVGLALMCVWAVNRRMTPTLLAQAEAKVTNEVTASVTRRVEDTLAADTLSYGDMVTIEKDSSGQITALTSNTVGLNLLRSKIISGVLSDLEGLAQETIPIPVGNLTGWDLLSDAGPAIKVGFLSTGIGSGEFRNSFSSAGVNQTRHQISLEVAVQVTILLPSGSVERTITTQVPVAETIIVGQVPQQYVSIGTGG